MFCTLYVFFWVIPRRLNFICRRFRTLCLFHLHRQVGKLFTYLPMKMEQTECSEMSAYKIQTPGNYPEENIQHTSPMLLYQQCNKSIHMTDGMRVASLSASLQHNKNAAMDHLCQIMFNWTLSCKFKMPC